MTSGTEGVAQRQAAYRRDMATNLVGYAMMAFAVLCCILVVRNLWRRRPGRAAMYAVGALALGVFGVAFSAQQTMF